MRTSICRSVSSFSALLALSLSTASRAQDECAADLDGDGVVSGSDLGIMLGAWGKCSGCAADVDVSGVVDGADLAALLGFWNESCAPLDWATVLEFDPDPTIVIDESLRNAIVATGLPWRVRDNASQIEMLLVPSGTFDMGCSPSNQHTCLSQENPVHSVTLTKAFYLGRFEVTQAQWTAIMGSNPSDFQNASFQVPAGQVANRPVDSVSWNSIQGFVAATGLRLPTEAEWEYAYRAGTTTAFHSMPGFPNGTNNDNEVGTIAWFSSNSSNQTRPVGGKAGNGLGMHDMSGNVLEWVNDGYSSAYYASSPAVDPPGAVNEVLRVMRGGSWALHSGYQRSSDRDGFGPNFAFSTFGFRVARTP